jgi:hypothetical protein
LKTEYKPKNEGAVMNKLVLILLVVLSVAAVPLIIDLIIKWLRKRKSQTVEAPMADSSKNDHDLLLETEEGRQAIREIDLSKIEIAKSCANQNTLSEKIKEVELEKNFYQLKNEALGLKKDSLDAETEAFPDLQGQSKNEKKLLQIDLEKKELKRKILLSDLRTADCRPIEMTIEKPRNQKYWWLWPVLAGVAIIAAIINYLVH